MRHGHLAALILLSAVVPAAVPTVRDALISKWKVVVGFGSANGAALDFAKDGTVTTPTGPGAFAVTVDSLVITTVTNRTERRETLLIKKLTSRELVVALPAHPEAVARLEPV